MPISTYCQDSVVRVPRRAGIDDEIVQRDIGRAIARIVIDEDHGTGVSGSRVWLVRLRRSRRRLRALPSCERRRLSYRDRQQRAAYRRPIWIDAIDIL
jgi:hypothetical protein